MEFDLEDASHCSLYIQMHFAADQRKQVAKVADFYLQTLKKEISKKHSFSDLFQMKMIKPGQLTSKAGRETWLKAWQHNRNCRYVTLPAPKV